jgi:hypothetical protein
MDTAIAWLRENWEGPTALVAGLVFVFWDRIKPFLSGILSRTKQIVTPTSPGIAQREAAMDSAMGLLRYCLDSDNDKGKDAVLALLETLKPVEVVPDAK